MATIQPRTSRSGPSSPSTSCTWPSPGTARSTCTSWGGPSGFRRIRCSWSSTYSHSSPYYVRIASLYNIFNLGRFGVFTTEICVLKGSDQHSLDDLYDKSDLYSLFSTLPTFLYVILGNIILLFIIELIVHYKKSQL